MYLLKNIGDCSIKTIAVDFDGTLCVKQKFPQIGAPKTELINWLIRQREYGKKVILWTCREDENLTAAIKWCKTYGLEFDAVNCNVEPAPFKTRKVIADIYIDDRACVPCYVENL